MGEAEARERPVGQCIYCGASQNLSDEHVLPFALGGHLVLRKASCGTCAGITGALERRLLRGPWWPYRRILGLPSRRPNEQPAAFPATLRRASGESLPVGIQAADYPCVMVFYFDAPGILSGAETSDVPVAARPFMKLLGRLPSSVLVEGRPEPVTPSDKIEFPVNMEAADFVRLLAKVALGYAVRRRGLMSFAEIFVRQIVLGDGRGALRYVGCENSPLIGATLPGHGPHGLMDRVRGDLLSVYVQLFRDQGAPLPIYEVVVGRLSSM